MLQENRGTGMGRRDELIALYAEDLRTKCGIEPDMDLLEQVTLACGPLIYDADAALVAGTDRAEQDGEDSLLHLRKKCVGDSEL